jgi:flagellar biosynthetic protein FliR
MDALHWERVFTGMMLVGARIAGLMVFAPFFSSQAIAPRVKVCWVVALTALLYPTCASKLPAPELFAWVQGMLAEAVVGLVMGLSVHFLFDAAQLAGQVLGFQVGFSLVNVIDPQTQVDTPVLSIFHQSLALLIFLQLDVHHWLVRGLARSFRYLPAGSAVATPALVTELMRVVGGLWLAGVQIAGPALAATMLADVALGFLGKASPQLPVLFLGLSIKSLLGFAVLAAGVALWPVMFERRFAEALVHGEQLLHLAR